MKIPSETTVALQFAVGEIKRCLSLRLYYPALQSSLSLIDACSCLEQKNGTHKKGKAGEDFRDWATKNLLDRMGGISAEHLWQLRNGVLHQGTARNQEGHRTFILLLGQNGLQMFGCKVTSDDPIFGGTSYINNVDLFCHAILDEVLVWAENADQLPNVLDNLDNLVRVRRETICQAGTIISSAIFLG
ncbi:hypothetical protein [Agrobacterium tumefaciens]|uniref:hypothetical protein n=1 Tax=Agrobacterium tumefaciens TaxID=358 RepID=UPI003BA08DBB